MKKTFVLLMVFVGIPAFVYDIIDRACFNEAKRKLACDIRRTECKLGQHVSEKILGEVAVHLRKDDLKMRAIEYGRLREATDALYSAYQPEGEWKSPYSTIQRVVNLHADCIVGDACFVRKFDAYREAQKKDQAFAKSLEMEKLLTEFQNLWWRVHDVDSWADLKGFDKEFQETKKNLLQMLGEPDSDDSLPPVTVFLPTEETKPQQEAPKQKVYKTKYMC